MSTYNWSELTHLLSRMNQIMSNKDVSIFGPTATSVFDVPEKPVVDSHLPRHVQGIDVPGHGCSCARFVDVPSNLTVTDWNIRELIKWHLGKSTMENEKVTDLTVDWRCWVYHMVRFIILIKDNEFEANPKLISPEAWPGPGQRWTAIRLGASSHQSSVGNAKL